MIDLPVNSEIIGLMEVMKLVLGSSGINYLVRLVEIKQKRPVAAILDVSISRP